MLNSIRSRLLGLVFAAAVPFVALIGFGLWSQWQHVGRATPAQPGN
jgi:hypothetical protein